jgi:hypothetical protein|tara:strand:- start:1027 stop:1149 length:123 start_codon:yes stop_codon:yes gene_type:complete
MVDSIECPVETLITHPYTDLHLVVEADILATEAASVTDRI